MYEELKILIKQLAGKDCKRIDLDINSYELVENIKLRIKEKEGILINQQRLIYNGIELNDFRRLTTYKIQNQSSIYLTLRESKLIQIQIQKINGETMKIYCKTLDTIRDIKNEIRLKEGTPISQQRLVFNGVLSNYKTLNEYNITSNSNLVLIYQKRIQIIAKYDKNLLCKPIDLECDELDTIETVKDQIHSKIGASPYEIRLAFNGKQLENSKTLKNYRIQNGSALDLVSWFVTRIDRSFN